MENINELNMINYNHIVELTKYFIEKYRNKEIKTIDGIIRGVLMYSSSIQEMDYVFDESVWQPIKPFDYNNLVRFRVCLNNQIGYLYFDLYLNEDRQDF